MFTDEDLKEYKARAIILERQHTLNLIARLEAAETYIDSMPENVTDESCRLYKEWRKACGK